MATINESQTVTNELVITERVVTSEFIIVSLQEDIRGRNVRAEIEFGPLETREEPGGSVVYGLGGRRSITVWENEAYDAVRDTWHNSDLMAVVKAAVEAL